MNITSKLTDEKFIEWIYTLPIQITSEDFIIEPIVGYVSSTSYYNHNKDTIKNIVNTRYGKKPVAFIIVCKILHDINYSTMIISFHEYETNDLFKEYRFDTRLFGWDLTDLKTNCEFIEEKIKEYQHDDDCYIKLIKDIRSKFNDSYSDGTLKIKEICQ